MQQQKNPSSKNDLKEHEILKQCFEHEILKQCFEHQIWSRKRAPLDFDLVPEVGKKRRDDVDDDIGDGDDDEDVSVKGSIDALEVVEKTKMMMNIATMKKSMEVVDIEHSDQSDENVDLSSTKHATRQMRSLDDSTMTKHETQLNLEGDIFLVDRRNQLMMMSNL